MLIKAPRNGRGILIAKFRLPKYFHKYLSGGSIKFIPENKNFLNSWSISMYQVIVPNIRK